MRGSYIVDKVFNMVKVVASNQQQHAKEIKNEIKDEIREVKKAIASGFEDIHETCRLEDAVEEMKDNIKNETDLLSKDIKGVKTLLASGSMETNETRLEEVAQEMKDKIDNEVDLLRNDIKGVKTMLASRAVEMSETRLEELVKKMKDEMEEVVRQINEEIDVEMDVLRDEVKDVKRLLAQTPKQRLVSALVCE